MENCRIAPLLMSLAVVGILAGSLTLAGAGDSADSALTTEDVVKLWTAGTPVDRLLERIRDQAHAFDLDPEVVLELDVIGFPETLVRAMRLKNNAIRRRSSAGTEARDDEGQLLRIRLNPGQSRPAQRRLRVYEDVDAGLVRRWDVQPSSNPRFTDVGVFLACSTPTHVPDGWRNHTPLAWESQLIPRHRILALHAGVDRGEARARKLGLEKPDVRVYGDRGSATVAPKLGRRKRGLLIYQLPAAVEARLKPGVAHDVHVGIALKIGEKYYPWAASRLEDLTIGDEAVDLDATILGLSGRNLDAIDLQFADEVRARVRTARTCQRGSALKR